MPTLHTCLSNTPRRTLLVMARLHGLAPSAQTPKDKLIDWLARTLLTPGYLQRIVLQLTEDEQAVLSTLLASDNRLLQTTFERRFGPIRPYKPWRKDTPRRPWENPAWPGERPFYLGLIFVGVGPGHWRDLPHILIPDDLPLAAALVRPSPASPARPILPDDVAWSRADLCRDIAVLLGVLHRKDVRPLRRRWLPLRTLAEWDARCSVSDGLADVRSELQTNRLRTMHFLAQAAGLLGLSQLCLKPTLLGWEWLAHERETRLRSLWQAWQDQAPLWRTYRLPGYDCPRTLSNSLEPAITTYLPRLAQAVHAAGVGRWSNVNAFVTHLLETDPPQAPDWEFYPLQSRVGMLTGLISGFLQHLGVTRVQGDAFCFTPIGAWLLGTMPAPPFPPIEPFVLAPVPGEKDDQITHFAIQAPTHPNLAHLARLEGFADWEAWCVPAHSEHEANSTALYRLTSSSLNRARERGQTLEHVLDLLEQATASPLSRIVCKTLRAWDQAGARMSISRPVVLECDDAAILSELARKRRFRQHIVRTLSPRAVILDDAHLPAAVRLLRREGHNPRVLLPSAQTRSDHVAGRSEVAFHLLAGRVYQGLLGFIPLPALYPSEWLDKMVRSLPPAELAAAQNAAARVLDALASAIDGWTSLPSPQPGLDPERLAPRIEDAIRRGACLRITYWTAGRGALTHRVVEPQRIERRVRTLYLVAYCRQARAERVFRLDRIQQMDVIES